MKRIHQLPDPLTPDRDGLPANHDAERFVLGAILMDDALYIQVAGALEADDFSLEKHRRIFLRMGKLYARGDRIDRVTVANELMKQNQLESVGGISAIVSLDEGLPVLSNLPSYTRIVREKSQLRSVMIECQKLSAGSCSRNGPLQRIDPGAY